MLILSCPSNQLTSKGLPHRLQKRIGERYYNLYAMIVPPALSLMVYIVNHSIRIYQLGKCTKIQSGVARLDTV